MNPSKERISLDIIAKGFEKIRTVHDGAVAFVSYTFHDLQSALITSIEWKPSIPEIERERIARQATFAAGEKGPITKDTLLSAIWKSESSYLALPSKTFVVVFSLSLKYTKELKKMLVDSARISFHSEIPKRFQVKATGRPWDPQVPANAFPKAYTVACVCVSARSAISAEYKAMSAIEIFRGVLNFVINRRKIASFHIGGSSKWEAINEIRLGTSHTVQSSDGVLEKEGIWSTVYDVHPAPSYCHQKLPEIIKTARKQLRRSMRVPYSDDMHRMWMRYANALDRRDLDASFLKLWSLLEFVTGTNGERYDETIRRTLFICDDRDFHKTMLEHLRDRRNSLVHSDDNSPQVEHHVFQVKSYVEEFLRLHLAHAGRFKTRAAFGEFLGLPPDLDHLEDRVRVYKHAIFFRKGTLEFGKKINATNSQKG
ncbi:MAG TPA: hypothetical protein VFB72_02125 [Verrucomicrobiae bacterium]|nr:hypothetical protein [Verrucomicrobiae bacterium]